ncbi:MAG: CRISPR-associated helicase Cas3' [Nitrososphaerales archaeon]
MTQVILAKSSGETLVEHTFHCLNVAETLLKLLPLDENTVHRLRNDLLLSLAIHDVGKAAVGFQKVLRNELEGWGKRHEIISAAFGSAIADLSEEALLAVLTHHKSLPSDGIESDIGCLPLEQIPWEDDLTEIWNEMAKEWVSNFSSFSIAWKQICQRIKREDLAENIKLSSLRVDKAWLRRNKQRKTKSFKQRYYASLLRGLVITCDHLGSQRIIPQPIPMLKDFKLPDVKFHAFQEKAAKTYGNVMLRAPTGSGKTIAALLWARTNQKNNGRLFYVLPNIASINAMFRLLQTNYGKGCVGLLHSRAASSLYSMIDNDQSSKLHNQKYARALSSLAREMWFPIRVCTPHQILRYSLRGKGWETMLAEFPNSIFIFDEIHAYDPRITGLTLATAKHLLSWNAMCMFLSATLPEFLQKLIEEELGNVPLIEPDISDPRDKVILDQKRHFVQIKEGNILSRIDSIVDKIEQAKSTLIVCNHVPTSQRVFQEVEKHLGETQVKLLHSRFARRDRNRIEQEITKGDPPKVLVATQVVEVSLDIDFEQAFLEPAPIDALIQRMGRVNRRGERKPAMVGIFKEQFHDFPIYNNDLVKRSLEEISNLSNPLSENDLIEASNRVYSAGYQGDDKIIYEEGLNHPDIKDFERNILAGAHQQWVEQIIDKSDGTLEILPALLKDEYNEKEDRGLLLEANDLLVPVRVGSVQKIKKYLDTTKDIWIINQPYSERLGLSFDGEYME